MCWRLLLPVSIVAAAIGGNAASAQTLEEHLRQVHEADATKRRVAIMVLKAFPPDGQVVTALIEALNDNVDYCRYTAASVLGQLGVEADRVVPALVDALDDQSARVRSNAAAALRHFSDVASPALSKLASLLADQDYPVRESAIEGLSGFHSTSSEARSLIAGRLLDTSPPVRSAAIAALSRLGEEGREYLPRFIAALDDPSDQVRSAAARAVGPLAISDAAALRALIAASRTSRAGSLSWIGRAIVDISARESGSVVPLLIKALNDPENSTEGRVFAAETLGIIGSPARGALPELLSASKTGPTPIRQAAADAVAKLDPNGVAPGPEPLSKLIAMLGAGDAHSQDRARAELVKGGAKAIPLLLEVLRNDSRIEVRVAVVVLEEFHQDEVTPVLIELASSGDSSEVQNAAVNALGYIGLRAGGESALKSLIAAMHDPKLREAAIRALGNSHEASASAVPAIKEVLEGALNRRPPDWATVEQSLGALGRIGSRYQSLLLLVLPLLNQSDGIVRIPAVQALGGMPLTESVAALLQLLHHPMDWPREQAARSLGYILSKPDGRMYTDEVVAALMEHLKDPAVKVRAAVAGSLATSGAPAAARSFIEALDDPGGEVRSVAAGGLGLLLKNPGAAGIRDAALPALIRALDDADDSVVMYAAVGLQTYGRSAAPALPALRQTLAKANSEAAKAITDAIRAIE